MVKKNAQLPKKTLRKWATTQVEKGQILLTEKDFVNPPSFTEGELVEIIGIDHAFLGYGYLAKQHKGIGWILTRDQNADTGLLADLDFVQEKLQAAKNQRQTLLIDDMTTAFRIFNGEGDGIGGFTIDWYAGYALIQWYSEGIYRYKAIILEALNNVYPELKGIVGKNRFNLDGTGTNKQSEVLAGDIPETLTVQENGVNYIVRLDDGWMTGIFLDQRNVRNYIQTEIAPGKSLLNLFSYTGAFSVAAALGGAAETMSVDVAKRSLQLTAEQFQANGLEIGDQHKVRVMDVFNYLDYAKTHDLRFDIVVLDPPSFSRTKKHTFQANKDYRKLVASALAILNKGGYLVSSTNAANMTKEDFIKQIAEGSDDANVDIMPVADFGLPVDFPAPKGNPESDYLKVEIFQKL
ncbi:class I SAM-dependent rRNA methyltransferase [Aerococcus sp. HMSC10H05]|uniref:class I SAM-dependent rRNA methyltransferase n=1 Tax=Aerococcus sp. HMSC10H05 TaxID=1581084 RepID=UPI0008A33562|nr:class I SAM-dependent rRNA methyltransferase [Aerococcus sp. HMSC10H05]OFU48173.1 SAM-dependent methyltransferase [Aerococcus sp. HMSC10H05]